MAGRRHQGAYTVQKPDNALKRADERILSASPSNAASEKRFALEQLHNVIVGAKRKQWQKVYEPIMKRHLELCVDLKDIRLAKDGLHQYRNMVTNVDPQSLEVVILHFIDEAEARATSARDKANSVALAAAAKIGDLEQEETPESIMLSSMTDEGAKDRTDREVVVPWLKFLWETYRSVLELLYRMVKLDRVYHKTCEKAFTFCSTYERKLEFRRLCETLRSHMMILQRSGGSQFNKVNRGVTFEWTQEAIDMHLQTRFYQLEVSITLELWNESFRTVEDIYAIIQMSEKTPKPRLMVSYYEKLTRIFWVSKNHLFHAYSWFFFYCLGRDSKMPIEPEQKTFYASNILLSALCIAPTSVDDSSPDTVVAGTESILEKNKQMASLLDFPSNPSRQALLGEIVARGILNIVPPEIAEIYHQLEVNFQPLLLPKRMRVLLDFVKNDPQLQKYETELERVMIIRSVQQLSRVYSTVQISFAKSLFSSFDLSFFAIERMLVECVFQKQLKLYIDHSAGLISFGVKEAKAKEFEVEIASLGFKLAEAMRAGQLVDEPPSVAEERCRKYMKDLATSADEEHMLALERKSIIERRKEGLERVQQERQRLEKEIKEKDEVVRREMEKKRIEQEEEERERERISKAREAQNVERIARAIEATGKTADIAAIGGADSKSREAMLEAARNQFHKAKEDEQKRLIDAARRLDHVTRALRLEGASVMAAKFETQKKEDEKAYQDMLKKVEDEARMTHQKALAEKARFSRMAPFRAAFESKLKKAHSTSNQ